MLRPSAGDMACQFVFDGMILAVLVWLMLSVDAFRLLIVQPENANKFNCT